MPKYVSDGIVKKYNPSFKQGYCKDIYEMGFSFVCHAKAHYKKQSQLPNSMTVAHI